MKYKLILISLLFVISCKESNDCYRRVHQELESGGSIGFMIHGGFLDKYDNGRVFISIVRVNNPKDWDYNDYFTGEDFSPNEEDEMRVPREDSCQLKELYFQYLKEVK